MTTADPIAAFRSELRGAAIRQRRSSRRRLVAVAVVALVAIIALTGVATGGVGWLTGTPAPHSVIADFGTYTPQLGFHPDPGSAVLVASDGDSHLYATTNAEDSYCIAVSTPWRNLGQEPDGGTCVSKATAEKPIVAGLPSGTADTVVLAGRVAVAGAVSVSVQLRDGTTRTIPLGTSGFFISNIQGKPCQHGDQYGDWSPQFVALNSAGKPVAASTIPLEHEYLDKSGAPMACGGPVAPIGEVTPAATADTSP
jgi:hypothetical protein